MRPVDALFALALLLSALSCAGYVTVDRGASPALHHVLCGAP